MSVSLKNIIPINLNAKEINISTSTSNLDVCGGSTYNSNPSIRHI
jgi:hypothetical protein